MISGTFPGNLCYSLFPRFERPKVLKRAIIRRSTFINISTGYVCAYDGIWTRSIT